MKKTLLTLFAIAILGLNIASADILPEGEKVIPVCAFFNNTADFADEFGVFVQEYSVSNQIIPYEKLISNECFSKGYKFNNFNVYGVSIEFLHEIFEDEEIDLREFEGAYLTDVYPTNGQFTDEDTSPVARYKYEYTILGMDYENKKLKIQLLGTHIYNTDDSHTFEPVKTQEIENVFTDVDSNSSYYNALKYLKEEGIVSGYADGSFKPYEKINRAEFTKIIVEANSTDSEISDCLSYYANQTNTPAKIFNDVIAYFGSTTPSDWYLNYVCVAKQKEYINGYPDGSFKPSQNINFVESAKIITKAMGILIDENSPWYKIYVEYLDTRNAIPSTISSFSQLITRGEMAEMIYRLSNNISSLPSNTYDYLK